MWNCMLLTLNSICRYLVVERYSGVTVEPLFYPTIRRYVYYSPHGFFNGISGSTVLKLYKLYRSNCKTQMPKKVPLAVTFLVFQTHLFPSETV